MLKYILAKQIFKQKLSFYISIMQEYPVFRPQNYKGIGLLLSNAHPTNPQTQTYIQRNTSEPNLTFRSQSPPVVVSRPPVVYQTKPQALSRVQQRVKNELIKGDSRIEYVPVEKKVVDFIDEPRYKIVPKKKVITDYRDIIRVETVPREVVTTDYYAVEHIRSYVPQVIPEKYVDYVAVERKNVSYQYIPIQRQLVHYPNRSHQEQSSRYLGVRQVRGPKVYENMREQDVQYWEREYGYVRGQPLSVLNQKIRRKVQLEKEQYFKQFQSRSTSAMDRTIHSVIAPQPLTPFGVSNVTTTVPNVNISVNSPGPSVITNTGGVARGGSSGGLPSGSGVRVVTGGVSGATFGPGTNKIESTFLSDNEPRRTQEQRGQTQSGIGMRLIQRKDQYQRNREERSKS